MPFWVSPQHQLLSLSLNDLDYHNMGNQFRKIRILLFGTMIGSSLVYASNDAMDKTQFWDWTVEILFNSILDNWWGLTKLYVCLWELWIHWLLITLGPRELQVWAHCRDAFQIIDISRRESSSLTMDCKCGLIEWCLEDSSQDIWEFLNDYLTIK